MQQAAIDAATGTTGEEKRTRNEWYNEKCREDIREKNEDRLHMLQRTTRQTYDKYKESRKKVNKIICSKKKAYLKKEIENIEFLSKQNDNMKFHQAVKKLNKGFQPRLDICKDKNGTVIGDKS
jgi:hypothetical protein